MWFRTLLRSLPQQLFLKVSIVFVVLLFKSSCSEADALKLIDGSGIMTATVQGFEDCGWLIDIDGQFLQPTHLPSQYQEQDLKVRLTYEDLGAVNGCQQGDLALRAIRIIQIRQF